MPPRENKLDLDTVVTLGVIAYPDGVCYQYGVGHVRNGRRTLVVRSDYGILRVENSRRLGGWYTNDSNHFIVVPVVVNENDQHW